MVDTDAAETVFQSVRIQEAFHRVNRRRLTGKKESPQVATPFIGNEKVTIVSFVRREQRSIFLFVNICASNETKIHEEMFTGPKRAFRRRIVAFRLFCHLCTGADVAVKEFILSGEGRYTNSKLGNVIGYKSAGASKLVMPNLVQSTAVRAVDNKFVSGGHACTISSGFRFLAYVPKTIPHFQWDRGAVETFSRLEA